MENTVPLVSVRRSPGIKKKKNYLVPAVTLAQIKCGPIIVLVQAIRLPTLLSMCLDVKGAVAPGIVPSNVALHKESLWVSSQIRRIDEVYLNI